MAINHRKEEIPFDKNVNLIQIRTWYRRSRTKGENGEKTITTPTTKNPLTGEKSW